MIVELPNDVITVALRVAFNHENILEKRICRSCHVAEASLTPTLNVKLDIVLYFCCHHTYFPFFQMFHKKLYFRISWGLTLQPIV